MVSCYPCFKQVCKEERAGEAEAPAPVSCYFASEATSQQVKLRSNSELSLLEHCRACGSICLAA